VFSISDSVDRTGASQCLLFSLLLRMHMGVHTGQCCSVASSPRAKHLWMEVTAGKNCVMESWNNCDRSASHFPFRLPLSPKFSLPHFYVRQKEGNFCVRVPNFLPTGSCIPTHNIINEQESLLTSRCVCRSIHTLKVLGFFFFLPFFFSVEIYL